MRAVIRRARTLLAVAATGALLGSGCTTFTDNDAIARVGDIELSSEALRERAAARGAPAEGALDGDAVRQEVGAWIDEQLVGMIDPQQAAASYADGLIASGSICVQVIIVDPADAPATVGDLRAGADFATVFAQRNIDPGGEATGGRVGCLALRDLPLDAGNPFVEALFDLDDTNRITVAEIPGSGGGQPIAGVIRFIPYDELLPDETPVVFANATATSGDVDVYVDPRYGAYDAATGAIVPLG